MASPQINGRQASREPSSRDTSSCECPSCLGPLFSAQVPPCGHAICLDCVTKIESLAQEAMRRGIISNEAPYGAQTTGPRCPVCRAAVHRTQYVRCYALEAAARAMHPEECAAAEARHAALAAQMGPPPPVGTLADLRHWKAAQEEQAVAKAVEMIWKSIKESLMDSSALLIRGNTPSGGLWARPRPQFLHEVQDAFEAGPADVEVFLQTVWGCAEEISRRLEAEGVVMTQFTFKGVPHALIQWPEIPSRFKKL